MKNIEKYYDELLTQKKDEPLCYIATHILKIGCGNCDPCHRRILKWLNEEYKEPIQLTHDEYVILKNLPSEYKYIARDEDNAIDVYQYEPTEKEVGFGWKIDGGKVGYLDVFNHLFPFVLSCNDKPYSIQQLIADYEKEHGDE